MGVYQAIRQEKVYTQGLLKLTHINFVILNSYVKVIYLSFVKNTYFQAVENIKFGNSCIGFFQTRILYIKMTSVRKSYSYISKNLLKNVTLLPAEMFENINLNQQTVLLKIIYDFRTEISFMEIQKFFISKKLHSDTYFQLQ